MSASPNQARDVFVAAVRLAPEQWDAYLAEACGGDEALRDRVRNLLIAHQSAGSFLAPVAAGLAVTTDDSPSEKPGDVFGSYKLLEQIGEGGFGVVFMAEQTEPVRRKVALKVLKAGMDTRQVVARFEAERQALAIMDHPNIARVFDGGATTSGRPYFVMELVKGVPITEFCDQNHLTPRQRLELFLTVCQAVQHAHQKGIIHRDIKPTNVLVTVHDTKPVVKVIDFGVAKALGQELTDKTLFTGYAQMIGTPLYMSPEQAGQSGLDIDTRSDIYSLGVLLYELLTGTTPFSKERFQKAAYDEIRRIIREEEPSKPSTKLSTADGLPTLAANRGTEPAKLTRLVRGELDWIVMRALEKDRNRRYETANGFAADVQRYLADEPVQACPPSAGYRLRKFTRRNRATLAVAALVLFFLVLLGSGAGWAWRDRSAREAEEARLQSEREAEAARQQAARQGKVAGQVESIFGEVERLETEQKWPEALAAARRAEAAVTGGEADPATAERVRQRLKELELIDRLEQIRMEGREYQDDAVAQRDQDYARAFRDYGVDVDELTVEASIQRLKARPALAIPLAAALDAWVFLRRQHTPAKKEIGGWERLVAMARGIDPEPLRDRLRSTWGRPVSETRDELRRLADSIDIGAQHPATILCLVRTLQQAELRESALRILRDAHYVHPADYYLNLALAGVLSGQKDHEGAIRFYTAALSLRPHVYAPYDGLSSALSHLGRRNELAIVRHKEGEIGATKAGRDFFLGNALSDRGKLDEAIDAYRKAIDSKFAAYGDLGNALRARGKPDEAIEAYRKAIEAVPGDAGKRWRDIGDTLRDQKKPAEAADAYRKAIEAHRQGIQARPERAVDLLLTIGDILRDQRKPDEANAIYREAIEAVPKNAVGYANLGRALSDRGKLDEAIDAYRKAVEATPDLKQHTYPLVGLADALSKKKRLPEAIDAYHKLLEVDPKYASAYFGLGDILHAQGKLDEAIDAYYKAIDLDPKSQFAAGAYTKLGIALIDQKNLPAAILAYRRTIELDPEHLAAGANINLGNVLRAQGKPDEAIACFKKAIAINQPYATIAAHVQLGDVLSEQNKLDEAIVVYRKIIELKPDSPQTHSKLAWILAARPEAKLRDPQEALVLAKRAVELAPTSERSWQYLGWIQYRTGDWKSSIEALVKSCKVQMGGMGDYGQWIVLALAHARLAAQEGLPEKEREQHKAEASRWFDKADKQIDSRYRARPAEVIGRAIWDFRAEARELIGVKENKK